MNLATHLSVGAAAGALTQNPLLGLLAGILSHHLIDSIPHTDGGHLKVDVNNYSKDPRIIRIVLVDLILVLVIISALISKRDLYLPMLLGGIGGMLPDIIDNMPFWSKALRRFYIFRQYHLLHEKLHYTIVDPDLLWVGVAVQIFLIGASLVLI